MVTKLLLLIFQKSLSFFLLFNARRLKGYTFIIREVFEISNLVRKTNVGPFANSILIQSENTNILILTVKIGELEYKIIYRVFSIKLRAQRARQQQNLFSSQNPPQSPFRQRNPLLENGNDTMADERSDEVKINSSIQSNYYFQHIKRKRNDSEQNGKLMQSKTTTNTTDESNTDFNCTSKRFRQKWPVTQWHQSIQSKSVTTTRLNFSA